MKVIIFAKTSVRFPGKHMSDLNGKTLIDHVVNAIQSSSQISEILIYSKDAGVKSKFCDYVHDTSEGTIIDSLYSAIEQFGTIFAIAGDMPCLSPSIIEQMANMSGGKTVVPVHKNGMPEPLHSIYSTVGSGVLMNIIKTGKGRLRDFISAIPHEVFEIREEDEIHFYNVNYREDLLWIREKGCVENNLKGKN